MNRMIPWNTACFDEIELIYEKAARNDEIGTLLEELERGALAEAKALCAQMGENSNSVTPEQFDDLPIDMKERWIAVLADRGLLVFNPQVFEGKINVQLTEAFLTVSNCTIFGILNLLEKLDGAINVMHPSVMLELVVPAGSDAAVARFGKLAMKLYPWIRIAGRFYGKEVAHTASAGQTPERKPISQQPVTQKPVEKQARMPLQIDDEEDTKASRSGFFARLFGRKK